MQEKNAKENKIKRLEFISILLLMVVYTVLISVLSNRNTIWYDEAFGLVAVRHPLTELFRLLALDVHPPFFYLLLKMVSVFGDRAWFFYRMVSAIPVLCGLFGVAFYLRRRFSYLSALLFLLLMMASPNLLHFGVEMRMYGLAFCFVSFAMVSALELKEEESWVGYLFLGLFSLLGAYTHYFAGAAAVGICMSTFAVMMIKSQKKGKTFLHWLICVLGMALSYSPWLYIFLRQSLTVKNQFWLTEYTMKIAKDTFFFFLPKENLVSFILILVMLVVAGVSAAISLRRQADSVAVMAFSVLFPIVLGLGVSALVRPVFQAKYAFPVLGIFGMMAAILLSFYKRNWQKAALIILAALLLLSSLIPAAARELQCTSDQSVTQMLELLENEENADLSFYHTNPQLMGCFAAYFPERTQYISDERLKNEYYPSWTELGNVEVMEEPSGELLYVATSYDDLSGLEDGAATLIGRYRWSTYSGFEILVYRMGEGTE